LAKLAIVAALACSIGLHWGVLQSIAWVGMLAENLRNTALVQAVQRTFDGKHPCVLCQAISKGKKSEKKAELTAQIKKLELFNAAAGVLLVPVARFRRLAPASSLTRSLTYPPLLPPPRSQHP
jgi:hypothetical protein